MLPNRKKKIEPEPPAKKNAIKFISIVVGIIVGIVLVAWYINNYMEAQPSWAISLKQLHMVQYSNDKVPESRFEFDVENISSESHGISLVSVEFTAVDRKYLFRSASAKGNFEARSVGTLDVKESDLFFDTMLALPYDEETMALDFVFVSAGDSIVVHVVDSKVVKCIFMQEPDFDPFGAFQREVKVIFSAFKDEVQTDYGFYASKQTAPFLSLQIDLSDTTGISIADEVFYPTYGGICMFHIPDYPKLFGPVTPSDIFGELNEYQISETIRDKIDFDYTRASEFVVALFSSSVKRDTVSDQKTMPLQIIVTADPENKIVTALRDSLVQDGFRVIIEKGKSANLMDFLVNDDDTLWDDEPDSLLRMVANMNEALSNSKPIVLEIGAKADVFSNEIHGKLIDYGFDGFYVMNRPSSVRYRPLRQMALTDVPRILVLEVPDTILLDSVVVNGELIGLKTSIAGPRASLRSRN